MDSAMYRSRNLNKNEKNGKKIEMYNTRSIWIIGNYVLQLCNALLSDVIRTFIFIRLCLREYVSRRYLHDIEATLISGDYTCQIGSAVDAAHIFI